MLMFTDTTPLADKSKSEASRIAQLKTFFQPLPSEDDASASPRAGGARYKTFMLLTALMAGGGTYYALTQTTWGLSVRSKIGLAGARGRARTGDIPFSVITPEGREVPFGWYKTEAAAKSAWARKMPADWRSLAALIPHPAITVPRKRR